MTTRRGAWGSSNQNLNASSSSLQDLVGNTAPVVRWERTWSHARPFPAPPPHTIGNTPGIKVASVKAQFYKWKPAPEKEPVDFSEDDLYIIDEPDEDMDAEGQTGGEDNEAANEDDDAMETDTNELKQQLSESLGGGSSSTRSSGLKVNTHASRFLANNSNSFSNTPPNSAI
ncbi:hypothetical protein HDU79_001119 [Rhizoclosmatium sp. JEL0117]|nr:hypothetical protein HDU79_001119 [Rhizoclosmatium sp. JEL0117]